MSRSLCTPLMSSRNFDDSVSAGESVDAHRDETSANTIAMDERITTESASESKELRVLLLLSSSNIGGAEKSLSRMVMGSRDEQIRYEVATIGAAGSWSEWFRASGFQPRCFGSKRFALTSASLRLLRFCWDFRPRFIYVVGLRAALLVRILRPLLPRSDIVHGIRSSFPAGSEMARKFGLVERLFRQSTRHYVANSFSGARELAALINQSTDRFTVIHNGLDLLPACGSDISASDISVAVVANITAYKGHFEFLRVIQRVKEQLPSLRVVFVGRNDTGSALPEAIERLGLSQVVHLAGYQPNPESILRNVRVCALPSLVVEGCPTSILEAMALEIPVVAYRIGGIPELVQDGVTGFLVDSGDEEAFAQALIRLLGDPGLARRMGQAGRQVVIEQFSLERCARQHAELWRRLAAESIS